MNLRCIYCQTPFTLGRLEKLAAIQRLQAEELHHYDAFCPRCRRANPVSIQRLQIFTPGWQEGLQTLEAEAARMEKAAGMAPAPATAATAPAPAPAAPSRIRHAPKVEKMPFAPAVKEPPTVKAVVAIPAAKPAAKKAAKPVAKAKKLAVKPAKKAAKPAAKKPAAKKAAPKARPAKAKAKPKAAAKPKGKPKKKK